jgi:aryl-phospho-beta-D-glucosidase BglC (GH1 family)
MTKFLHLLGALSLISLAPMAQAQTTTTSDFAYLIANSFQVKQTTRTLPALKVSGMDLVDARGKKVVLKGTNLGNWLITENWMLCLAGKPGVPGDQHGIEALFTQRFGESEKERLMEVFRSSWMTSRDFDLVKSFGFNVVRLPMNYRMFEDDRAPFQLKPNAFKWVDYAIEQCTKRGIYVILDMHGAQGGQSVFDHTGHANQNQLEGNPVFQQRLAWLWGEFAKRYRNNGTVVAYDAFNEPYGMSKPSQVAVFNQVYDAIRKHDKEKLIYAHGHHDGYSHYGTPSANGWRNVGFQMHYYPGLFGNGEPTVENHLKHHASMNALAKRVKAMNVPFFVGEWNVVYDSAGGANMMRHTFDLYAKHGWASTSWAYKVLATDGGIQPVNWALVANTNPAIIINFETASKGTIEAYFRQFATAPLTPYSALRTALTDPNYNLPALPPLPVYRTSAPQETISGWTQTDIGNPLAGGLKNVTPTEFELYGGGEDIWGTADQFRFMSKPMSGNFDVEVTVKSIENIETYTKGGLMLRNTWAPNAAFAFFTVFPNGKAQISQRTAPGVEASDIFGIFDVPTPVTIKMERRGGTVTGKFKNALGAWQNVGSLTVSPSASFLVGPVAMSHDDNQLVKVVYQDVKLVQATGN